MDLADIDLQRISLSAPIIALALLVDDAMTTIDAMTRRLAAGDSMAKAEVFTCENLVSAMLVRNPRHHRRLRADRLRAELGRRIHLLDLRRGRDRTDHVMVRRPHLRSSPRHHPAAPPEQTAERKRGRCCVLIARQAKSGGMRPASTYRSTCCPPTCHSAVGRGGTRPRIGPVRAAHRLVSASRRQAVASLCLGSVPHLARRTPARDGALTSSRSRGEQRFRSARTISLQVATS